MIHLASRRELFVDHHLVDTLDGCALKLHPPHLEELPPSGGIYNTVLYEEGRYLLYYRKKLPPDDMKYSGNPAERVCIDESTDGRHFTPMDLGTRGDKHGDFNNVICDQLAMCHNFSPFIDTRPGTPADAKYKAISGVWHNNVPRIRADSGGKLPDDFEAGLYTFASPDGIHWRQTSDQPVITADVKAFDSQNIAFWSESEQHYVCYYRTWGPGGYEHGLRSIARATSPDFVHWTQGVHMHPNQEPEELYTSQVAPYYRAPHYYLAFPTRYMRDRDSSTDILFMSTRGGDTFDRPFRDALLRPGLDPRRWANRANYASVNIVPIGDQHIGVYVFSRYDMPALLLRYRLDGIASLAANWQGGTATTHPFTFTGDTLELNYSTSAAGSLRAALLHPDGSPIEGFAMDDCQPLVGDQLAQPLTWKAGSLAKLAGQPVRLHIQLLEADLFSLRFIPSQHQ